MATNYDELIKEVEIWGHRDDLSTLIPSFIQFAEVEMFNNQVEPLLIRDMESIQTTTTSTGKYLSLPSGYESTRSIRLILQSLDGGEVRYQSPEQMKRYQYTGKPNFFTIVGNEIEFDRVPDMEYEVEVQIYVKPDPLTEDNQTNTVLNNFPTIYLYGALSQFFIHAQDDTQASKYNELFFNSIRGANKSQKKGRYGPAPSMNLDCGMIV